jgi:hypothetical protein
MISRRHRSAKLRAPRRPTLQRVGLMHRKRLVSWNRPLCDRTRAGARSSKALAGLAPFNHDSGSIRGKRAIFDGRRALRSGLYMAALSAARYNPILSNFYRRMRLKGKPHKLALTPVMRNSSLALNSTLKPIACSP